MPEVDINEWGVRHDLRPSEIKMLTELRQHPTQANLDEIYRQWYAAVTISEALQAALPDKPVNKCRHCGAFKWQDIMVAVGRAERLYVCKRCYERHYWQCTECGVHTHAGQYVRNDANQRWCSWCIETHRVTQCRVCAAYYPAEDEHSHRCKCEAPVREFLFPDDGRDPVPNDTRVKVDMPKGTISDSGIAAILALLKKNLVRETLGTSSTPAFFHRVDKVVAGIEPVWQAKNGNYTKRLSAAFYKGYRIKLSEWLVSEIGNVARDYTAEAASFFLEFTRDFNHDPEFFGNPGSCLWTQYPNTRCSMKNWGALAIRSFTDDKSKECAGRVWCLPLDARMQPTHDVTGAHAFLLTNGYGNLQGITAARILSHMLGKTYRKILVEGHAHYYVNSGSGHLVADVETCGKYEQFTPGSTRRELHDQGDALQVLAAAQAPAREAVVA